MIWVELTFLAGLVALQVLWIRFMATRKPRTQGDSDGAP